MNGGKQTKAIIGAICVGSALLATAACGSAHTQSGAAKATPAAGAVAGLTSLSAPQGDPGSAPRKEPGDTASLKKAGTAAMNAVKDSTLLSVQAEDNGQIWEVQVAGPDGTERELEVDAAGSVVSKPRVKDTGAGEKARVMAIVKDAEVTFEDVVEKVSSSVPRGKITHLSLDRYSDNLLVWDVDVLTPDGVWHGIRVDANNGTVTKKGQRD